MNLLPTECLVDVFITAAPRITASREDASFMAGVKLANVPICFQDKLQTNIQHSEPEGSDKDKADRKFWN